jgi:hypothetical protein
MRHRLQSGRDIQKKTAASIGHENLKKLPILKRIHQLQKLKIIRTRIRADRIIEELSAIAFAKEGIKTSDKLKALGMLAKHVGLFEKQTDQPPDLILEDHESEIPPDCISEENDRLLNAPTPIQRQRIRRALEKQLREQKTNKQKMTTDTGLEAGNNGDEDQDDFDILGVIREQLPEHRFREVMEEAGLDPDGHASGKSPAQITEPACNNR